MSNNRRRSRSDVLQLATAFAALGDSTRLHLVEQLSSRPSQSISRLGAGSALSRQAITKHLRVLEEAGFVGRTRHGREVLYRLEPRRIAALQDHLDAISQQWDDALGRLKLFVEE